VDRCAPHCTAKNNANARVEQWGLSLRFNP
jgi:hypothetical protein